MKRFFIFRLPVHALLLALYTIKGAARAWMVMHMEWQVWWAATQQIESSYRT